MAAPIINAQAGNTTSRLPFIDAIKSLAIYLVIFYHVGWIEQSIEYTAYLKYYFYGLSTICVPIFFTINGYLLLNRQLILRKHILKTVNLYFLTLIWSAITVLCLMTIEGDRYSVYEFIKTVLFFKQGINNHLWFLFAMVLIYLLFPIIKIIYDYDDRKILLWMLFLLFMFTFGNIFANQCLSLLKHSFGFGMDVVNGNINMHNPFDHQKLNPFSLNVWILIYFVIGGLLGRHFEQEDPRIISVFWLCLIFLISSLVLFGYGVMVSGYLDGKLFDTVFDGFNSIPCLAMTIAVFLILYRLWNVDGIIGSFISSIGANTLGIYLLHIPVYRLIKPHYHELVISKFLITNFVYAMAILFLSWLLALFFKQVPGVAYLFKL